MKTQSSYPREFRIPASQEFIRSIKDPYFVKDSENDEITMIHALVKIRDFPNGQVPDKINPRSHEQINMKSKIPEGIADTLTEIPESFHLLNRGCLIIAKKAWFDNQAKMLHFVIESEDDHGMVDGATTDRVLKMLKGQVSLADFGLLKEDEIPDHFKRAYLHLEIVAGEISQELRLKLAEARNTSVQVKEFSLEDLGGGFDWLKDIIEKSVFHGKVRFRENEPKPVDIRTILALLTLFHPRWIDLKRDPIVAYSGKGAVLDIYKEKEAKLAYERLAPVVTSILELHDHVYIEFQKAYKAARAADGKKAKFGKRGAVKFIDEKTRAKVLPLTDQKTQYVIPDGWLYPVLGSLRMLLDWPKNGRGQVKWTTDPRAFFSKHGPEMVRFLIDRDGELGRNPNATGKSSGVWLGLRGIVENHLLREKLNQLEGSV